MTHFSYSKNSVVPLPSDLSSLLDREYVVQAVQNKRFENLALAFQPQYQAKTGALVGFEILSRFQHPRGYLIGPNEFIPSLHESNLLPVFDKTLLQHALSLMPQIHQAYGPKIRLSINISPVTLCHSDFLFHIQQIVKQTFVDPSLVCIEITETENFLPNVEDLISVVQSIDDMGLQVSLDDFGTGYSTIKQLSTLAVSEIKLDRQFVKNIDTRKGRDIIDAISNLGLVVADQIVAEGIETPIQRDYFANHHYNYLLQGFLFSAPVLFTQLLQRETIVHIATAARRQSCTHTVAAE